MAARCSTVVNHVLPPILRDRPTAATVSLAGETYWYHSLMPGLGRFSVAVEYTFKKSKDGRLS